jgi:tetratricopeptide (TPR) repeat protein
LTLPAGRARILALQNAGVEALRPVLPCRQERRTACDDVDFSKHLEKAEEALRRRNYDFAVEVYQQLLEIDPDQGEARSGLRQALKKRVESKQTNRLFRALGGAMPLATAKTLRKAGRHDACAKALESYLSSNPLDEEGNLLLGMALEDAGHFKSARAVYEFLAEIAPKNAVGLKRAGSMMYRTGDHAKALEYYERALQADPRDQEALKARKDLAAETAISKGGYEQIRHSREQIKDKDQARGLERARRAHLSDEELGEERTRLEAHYAEHPSDPDAMLELAEIVEKLKDYEAAAELVERALSYRQNAFDLVCRAGDLRSKVLKKAIARADKEGDQANAARLERELAQIEVADYRRRVDLHPADTALRVQHGKRLMKADALDEAMKELQKAIADPRLSREARSLMAQCFQRKGFLDLARKEYERALEGIAELDDRSKEILYNLGAIAETEGKAQEARAFYARVYEVDIGYRDVAAKMESFR